MRIIPTVWSTDNIPKVIVIDLLENTPKTTRYTTCKQVEMQCNDAAKKGDDFS